MDSIWGYILGCAVMLIAGWAAGKIHARIELLDERAAMLDKMICEMDSLDVALRNTQRQLASLQELRDITRCPN